MSTGGTGGTGGNEPATIDGGGSAGAPSESGGADSGGTGGTGGTGAEPEPEPPGIWDECASTLDCPLRIDGVNLSSHVRCGPLYSADDIKVCTFFCGDIVQAGHPEKMNPLRVQLCDNLGGQCSPYAGVPSGRVICQ